MVDTLKDHLSVLERTGLITIWDKGNIIQRRLTCAELAELASPFAVEQGDLAQAIKAWDLWSEAFKKSNDPRQVAMTKTFTRELAEMREIC